MVPKKTFTYFAYGSNMLQERLQERCRSARCVGVASVSGYDLDFCKRSIDGSAKATIIETGDGAVLYGVLFEIELKECPELDDAEGPGYEKKENFVVTRLDNDEKIVVTTYSAYQHWIDKALAPYGWYKKLVLAGARQGELPDAYFSQLEQIKSISDPEPHRTTRKTALSVLKESGWADA